MVTQSFTGDVINPIIDARLSKNFSAFALAKHLGLSRQYIQRAEAGTYTNLNPALLRWTANALLIEVSSVTKRYQQFQTARRRATMDEIDPHQLVRSEGNNAPGYIIFENWRAGYWPSTVAFANAFCVHPESIRGYEEGLRSEMPLILKQVLNDLKLIDSNWFEAKPLSGPLTA